MHQFQHQMKVHAEAVASIGGQSRWAIVTSSRSTDTGYQVKVQIQPEDVQTSWLPVLSPMVGSGWGLVCPPSPGQQVLITPYEGNGGHYAVTGMSFSNAAMPPQPGGNPVAPGEAAIVNANGSYLHIRNDGTVAINASTDVFINASNKVVMEVGTSAVITISESSVEVSVGATTLTVSSSGVAIVGTITCDNIISNGSITATGSITEHV